METKYDVSTRKPVLMDDTGERGGIDISEGVKDALAARGFIHYCDDCTANTTDTDYEAREYHLSGEHTFRCIAESGLVVPQIEDLIIPEDELCRTCRKATVIA